MTAMKRNTRQPSNNGHGSKAQQALRASQVGLIAALQALKRTLVQQRRLSPLHSALHQATEHCALRATPREQRLHPDAHSRVAIHGPFPPAGLLTLFGYVATGAELLRK